MKRADRNRLRRLCGRLFWQPDPEAAVRGLKTRELRDLHRYLAREGATRGVPGMFLGLIECVAAERLMTGKEGKDQ